MATAAACSSHHDQTPNDTLGGDGGQAQAGRGGGSCGGATSAGGADTANSSGGKSGAPSAGSGSGEGGADGSASGGGAGEASGGEPSGAAGNAGEAGSGGEAGGSGEVEPVTLPDPLAVGGPLTSEAYGTRPFLTPAPVDQVLLGSFSIGRELFVADWLQAPNATRPNIDGLGPLFHATSCLACHLADRRAPSLQPDGKVGVGLLIRLSRELSEDAFSTGDPSFGAQLQPAAVPGVPAEAVISWSVDPGSARPIFSALTEPSYGALTPSTRLLPRLSPQLVGVGLLELVDDETILAWEDPNDSNRDGISGRAARLHAGERIGRFGWKAIHPTLRAQMSAALAGDIGITSTVHPQDDCTSVEVACLAAANGGTPEIVDSNLNAIDQFMTYLAVPAARRDNHDPQLERGAALFAHVGCANCHRAELVTGDVSADPMLSFQTFNPYTDLLLHDLGAGLADATGEGDASASEWRTPPLWGIGLVEANAGARFLHDGRAASLREAILWHGGEATAAKAAYAALPSNDEQALLAFIRSL